MSKQFFVSIFKLLNILLSITATFVAAVMLFALLPLENNYKLMVVESGSMAPTIPAGSVILTAPRSHYSLGDIVTFSPSNKPQSYITHRIAGFADGIFGLVYKTKGDSNKSFDPQTLARENIFGKVLVIVPWVGLLLRQVQTPLGFILVVIVPATIVVYEEIKSVYSSVRESVMTYLHKRKRSALLSSDDHRLIEQVRSIRRDESTARLDPRLGVILLLLGTSFVFVSITRAFFNDRELGSGFLAAAQEFPGVTPTPQPDGHIVINEVFYDVDKNHGKDSPGDRGIDVGGHKTKSKYGPGLSHKNNGFVDIEHLCTVVQTNHTDADIDINITGNSGGNSMSGSTYNSSIITSGDVSNSVVVDIQGGDNIVSNFCDSGKLKNDEWVELYNPTDEIVNLKDWTLTDNSGIEVTITGNRFLGPGAFALISRDNSTWRFWDEPTGVLKIPLGRQIGDGLDDEGDHLLLKNSAGELVDAMSYITDTSQFILPGVGVGHSLEREPDGKDTDTAGDWFDRPLPQPGV